MRVRMLLTQEEADIINERRAVLNRDRAEERRREAFDKRPYCKHEFPSGMRCPMKANDSKDGYCGQHYNMAHGLKQWLPKC